jgi:hypothetical protein
MDITYDEWGMGYIYLKDSGHNLNSRKFRFQKPNCPIKSNDELGSQLNKLNQPDQKYLEARAEEDFIEEFRNDLDKGYLKGIELQMKKTPFKEMVENYQLKSFKYKNSQYYCICFAAAEEIFDPENYLYTFSDREDAFGIFKLNSKKLEAEDFSYKIAFFKALIFREDSPYDIDYFKSLKVY